MVIYCNRLVYSAKNLLTSFSDTYCVIVPVILKEGFVTILTESIGPLGPLPTNKLF